MRDFCFNPSQEGDRTEHLSHGGGMDPNRFFKGLTGKKSQSLNPLFSKPLLEEGSQNKIRDIE
jgi:hypothetical protein